MTKDQIDAASLDPATSVVELAIASIFMNAIKFGDCARLSFLLDRAVGKVPTMVQTPADIAARQEISSLSDEELVRLVQEKIPQLAKAE